MQKFLAGVLIGTLDGLFRLPIHVKMLPFPPRIYAADKIEEKFMKYFIRQLFFVLSLGTTFFVVCSTPGLTLAATGVTVPACDMEKFTQLEADFQQMTHIRAENPEVFSTEEYKAAALAYISSAEKCFHAAIQPSLQSDTDPVIIDEGGLSPYGEITPLYNSGGLKWGADSPYNPSGQNVSGPGTPGGTVTYSYIAAGKSHGYEGLGGNVDVRTSLGVNSCVKSEIATAFAAWSAAANLQFVEVADSGAASGASGATGHIRIGAHAFDGPAKILAHAYFPPFTGDTFNSIAGDMHFDSAETWSCTPGSGFDIGLVALHELGHSIGLNHEPTNGNLAVMNPTYNASLAALQADDINGAVAIYGTGVGIPVSPCIPIFSDDHEDGFADWEVTNGTGTNSWQGKSDSNGYDSSSQYWFAADIASVSDSYLRSSTINATTPGVFLQFFHAYNLEANNNSSTGYDGGVVEISVNSGAFADVGAVNFTKNGYNKTISASFNSPIASRPAFSGNSGSYIESVVDLSNLVSQGDNLRIRFRQANDSGTATSGGWSVDDVRVCTALKVHLPTILK